MKIAPTYVVNAVALLFLVSKLLGFDIPYTSTEVENALTLLVILGTPSFTMFRQWWTGRSTLSGRSLVR